MQETRGQGDNHDQITPPINVTTVAKWGISGDNAQGLRPLSWPAEEEDTALPSTPDEAGFARTLGLHELVPLSVTQDMGGEFMTFMPTTHIPLTYIITGMNLGYIRKILGRRETIKGNGSKAAYSPKIAYMPYRTELL